MAITSMDALVAAMPGQYIPIYKSFTGGRGLGSYVSSWRTGGIVPSAGTIPPTGNGAIPTNTTIGALPIRNPSSGNKLYLAKLSLTNLSNYVLVTLYDRLWHNSGFSQNTTAAQTIATPPVLTRPDALGEDVELWGEVYVAPGSTASVYSVTYTNQDGAAGRVATFVKPAVALVADEMVPFQLQGGDTGVRTVSQLQLSTATGGAGNFGLVLLRRIATTVVGLGTLSVKDTITLGMPEIPSDACLAFLATLSGSTFNVVGSVQLVEG